MNNILHMNFDPKKKYEGGIVFGGKIMVSGVPEITEAETRQYAKRQMEEVIPSAYRHKVTYLLKEVKDSLRGEKVIQWSYSP